MLSTWGKTEQNPLVSIVITSHNGFDYLETCLKSVFEQNYPRFEVLLVDNASTDCSVEFVTEHFPKVSVVESKVNLGYGGGNNLGAAAANGEYLLFLNHDTLVTEDFLSELVQETNHDYGTAIAQSKILMAAHPDKIETVGAFLTSLGLWIHPYRGEPSDVISPIQTEILGACGTCMLVRKEVFDELGGFDPDYIVYYDDADLSWRATLAGYKVTSVPKSVILHWGSGTTNHLPSTFTVFHSFKNRLCSLLKLLSPMDLIMVLPIHIVICMAGALMYILKLKPGGAMAIVRALVWNLLKVRSTLRKRSAVTQMISGSHRQKYRHLMMPLELSYFWRTSRSYVARW